MAQSKTILTVKSNPSGLAEHGAMDVYTWRMMKDEGGYKISINRVSEDKSRRRKIFKVREKTAEIWLHRLRSVQVSLLPEVSDSCDGSYYTFKFQNYGVSIELYWQNVAPLGAGALDKFVDWLWKHIPDAWSEEDAETDRLC